MAIFLRTKDEERAIEMIQMGEFHAERVTHIFGKLVLRDTYLGKAISLTGRAKPEKIAPHIEKLRASVFVSPEEEIFGHSLLKDWAPSEEIDRATLAARLDPRDLSPEKLAWMGLYEPCSQTTAAAIHTLLPGEKRLVATGVGTNRPTFKQALELIGHVPSTVKDQLRAFFPSVEKLPNLEKPSLFVEECLEKLIDGEGEMSEMIEWLKTLDAEFLPYLMPHLPNDARDGPTWFNQFPTPLASELRAILQNGLIGVLNEFLPADMQSMTDPLIHLTRSGAYAKKHEYEDKLDAVVEGAAEKGYETVAAKVPASIAEMLMLDGKLYYTPIHFIWERDAEGKLMLTLDIGTVEREKLTMEVNEECLTEEVMERLNSFEGSQLSVTDLMGPLTFLASEPLKKELHFGKVVTPIDHLRRYSDQSQSQWLRMRAATLFDYVIAHPDEDVSEYARKLLVDLDSLEFDGKENYVVTLQLLIKKSGVPTDSVTWLDSISSVADKKTIQSMRDSLVWAFGDEFIPVVNYLEEMIPEYAGVRSKRTQVPKNERTYEQKSCIIRFLSSSYMFLLYKAFYYALRYSYFLRMSRDDLKKIAMYTGAEFVWNHAILPLVPEQVWSWFYAVRREIFYNIIKLVLKVALSPENYNKILNRSTNIKDAVVATALDAIGASRLQLKMLDPVEPVFQKIDLEPSPGSKLDSTAYLSGNWVQLNLKEKKRKCSIPEEGKRPKWNSVDPEKELSNIVKWLDEDVNPSQIELWSCLVHADHLARCMDPSLKGFHLGSSFIYDNLRRDDGYKLSHDPDDWEALANIVRQLDPEKHYEQVPASLEDMKRHHNVLGEEELFYVQPTSTSLFSFAESVSFTPFFGKSPPEFRYYLQHSSGPEDIGWFFQNSFHLDGAVNNGFVYLKYLLYLAAGGKVKPSMLQLPPKERPSKRRSWLNPFAYFGDEHQINLHSKVRAAYLEGFPTLGVQKTFFCDDPNNAPTDESARINERDGRHVVDSGTVAATMVGFDFRTIEYLRAYPNSPDFSEKIDAAFENNNPLFMQLMRTPSIAIAWGEYFLEAYENAFAEQDYVRCIQLLKYSTLLESKASAMGIDTAGHFLRGQEIADELYPYCRPDHDLFFKYAKGVGLGLNDPALLFFAFNSPLKIIDYEKQSTVSRVMDWLSEKSDLDFWPGPEPIYESTDYCGAYRDAMWGIGDPTAVLNKITKIHGGLPTTENSWEKISLGASNLSSDWTNGQYVVQLHLGRIRERGRVVPMEFISQKHLETEIKKWVCGPTKRTGPSSYTAENEDVAIAVAGSCFSVVKSYNGELYSNCSEALVWTKQHLVSPSGAEPRPFISDQGKLLVDWIKDGALVKRELIDSEYREGKLILQSPYILTRAEKRKMLFPLTRFASLDRIHAEIAPGSQSITRIIFNDYSFEFVLVDGELVGTGQFQGCRIARNQQQLGGFGASLLLEAPSGGIKVVLPARQWMLGIVRSYMDSFGTFGDTALSQVYHNFLAAGSGSKIVVLNYDANNGAYTGQSPRDCAVFALQLIMRGDFKGARNLVREFDRLAHLGQQIDMSLWPDLIFLISVLNTDPLVKKMGLQMLAASEEAGRLYDACSGKVGLGGIAFLLRVLGEETELSSQDEWFAFQALIGMLEGQVRSKVPDWTESLDVESVVLNCLPEYHLRRYLYLCRAVGHELSLSARSLRFIRRCAQAEGLSFSTKNHLVKNPFTDTDMLGAAQGAVQYCLGKFTHYDAIDAESLEKRIDFDNVDPLAITETNPKSTFVRKFVSYYAAAKSGDLKEFLQLYRGGWDRETAMLMHILEVVQARPIIFPEPEELRALESNLKFIMTTSAAVDISLETAKRAGKAFVKRHAYYLLNGGLSWQGAEILPDMTRLNLTVLQPISQGMKLYRGWNEKPFNVRASARPVREVDRHDLLDQEKYFDKLMDELGDDLVIREVVTQQHRAVFEGRKAVFEAEGRTWEEWQVTPFTREEISQGVLHEILLLTAFEARLRQLETGNRSPRGYDMTKISFRHLMGYLLVDALSGSFIWSKQCECLEKLSEARFDQVLLTLLMSFGKTSRLIPLQNIFEADGEVFPINLWPVQVAQECTEGISKISGAFFGQRQFIFDLRSGKELTLKRLEAYKVSLGRALEEGEGVNATREDIEILEADLIQAIDRGEKGRRFELMVAILKLIHGKGKILMDEAHEGMDHKKMLNIPIGKAKTLPKEDWSTMRLFIRELMKDPKFVAAIEANELVEYSPEHVELVGDERTQGLLAGLKGELFKSVQKAPAHVGFGVEGVGNYAKPYRGNNDPNEASVCQSPHEALFKSWISYLIRGLTEENIMILQGRLDARIEKEAKMRKCKREATPTAKRIRNINFDDPKDAELIALFIQKVTMREIRYWQENVSIRSVNVTSAAKATVLYTGTPYNKGCYPHGYKNVEHKPTNEMKDRIMEERAGEVRQLHARDPMGILKEILLFKYHVILDPGALLKGIQNVDVARMMLESAPENIEGVIYFKRIGDGLYRKKVLLRSGDSAPFREVKIAPENRWTYYDQCHCVAEDVHQAPNAQAIMLVSEDNIDSELEQAAFRMRGIPKSETTQRIHYATNASIDNFEGIITRARANTAKKAKETNLEPTLHKVYDALRRMALQKIYANPKKAGGILTVFRSLFIMRVEDNPAKLWSGEICEESVEELLKKSFLDIYLRALDSRLFTDTEIAQLAHYLDDLTRFDPDMFPKVVRKRINSPVGGTVDVRNETEEEDEQENETEVAVRLSGSLGYKNKRWPKNLDPTDPRRWNHKVTTHSVRERVAEVFPAVAAAISEKLWCTESFLRTSDQVGDFCMRSPHHAMIRLNNDDTIRDVGLITLDGLAYWDMELRRTTNRDKNVLIWDMGSRVSIAGRKIDLRDNKELQEIEVAIRFIAGKGDAPKGQEDVLRRFVEKAGPCQVRKAFEDIYRRRGYTAFGTSDLEALVSQ